MNKDTFANLMALLRAVNPHVPLPDGFEAFLRTHMKIESACTTRRILESEGKKHKKAYYVVSGLVIVQGFADGLPYTASIYRENTIVAMNAFMKNSTARHTIIGTKGAVVWSISHEDMELIYEKWPGMRAFALQTAINYLEMKKTQRSALLALPVPERVLKFYTVFRGLLPARMSPVRGNEIAAYLCITEPTLRYHRDKFKNWIC